MGDATTGDQRAAGPASAAPGTAADAALAIDIGGTFTDVVLADRGRLHRAKTLTTPAEPTEGLVTGVRQVLAQAGTEPGRITRVVHGTTLATNVVLERQGAPLAYVTTHGFRTLLTMGHDARLDHERYDLLFQPPEPLVPPTRCFEVTERLSATGEVLVPLDEVEAREVARQIGALRVDGPDGGPSRVENVAVCLLHSYANPTHEERVAEICREELPHARVATSAAVWPELREHERASTTLVSAYVAPVMSAYLAGLTRRLLELGIAAPVQIMESSGAVMSAERAAARAVYTIESGPAAGVVAAAHTGAQAGCTEVIAFDMGGTTAKAGVITGGRPAITQDFHVGGQGSVAGRRTGGGIPVKVPAIDLAEVGAGGGSIAWVDAGGALRVGPQSAGADPGPACYDRGGDRPTVTDANLVLGYLDPGSFAGGGMRLRPELAEEAIAKHLTAPLGMSVAEAADAVHAILSSNMAAAVDVVTVRRGLDPAGFTLLASGGAGPTHVARLAEQFDMDRVLVPAASGVASAVGLLATDLRVERARTWRAALDPDEAETPELLRTLESAYRRLSATAADELGVALDQPGVTVERLAQVRFQGQSYELPVAAPSAFGSPADLAALRDAFFARYEETYGITLDAATELTSVRVRVTQHVPAVHLRSDGTDGTDDPAELTGDRTGEAETRRAWFSELGGYVDVAVVARDSWSGVPITGPAVVEEPEATLLVPPGWGAERDGRGNVLLRRSPSSAP